MLGPPAGEPPYALERRSATVLEVLPSAIQLHSVEAAISAREFHRVGAAIDEAASALVPRTTESENADRERFLAPRLEDDTLQFSILPVFFTADNVYLVRIFCYGFSTATDILTAVRIDVRVTGIPAEALLPEQVYVLLLYHLQLL